MTKTPYDGTAVTKKRGRPRSTPSQGDAHRTAILQAAARLFREQGYEKVSMTAVARELGMDQSSLYYWFKSKAQMLDEILVAEFNACGFKGMLFHAEGASCAQRLFALVYRRTAKFCALPVNVFDAECVADCNPELLQQFFGELSEYINGLRGLIAEGQECGEFAAMGVDEALLVALSAIMSQQHLFHRMQAGSALAVEFASGHAAGDAATWALRTARSVTAALLAEASGLQEAEEGARSCGWVGTDV